MDKKLLTGIYVPHERKAYFPEDGPLARNNLTIDRIRSALVQRGVLRYEKNQQGQVVANYHFVSYKEAQELGHEIIMVPVSRHIGRLVA